MKNGLLRTKEYVVMAISPSFLPKDVHKQFQVGDGQDGIAREAYRYVLPIEFALGAVASQRWTGFVAEIERRIAQVNFAGNMTAARTDQSLSVSLWMSVLHLKPENI